MKSIKEILERFKPHPSDVVGIDIGATGVKAVRMRKNNNEVSVLAADILPPAQISTDGSPPQAISVPSKLKAKYAAMTISGDNAVVKLLSFPGHFDARAEEKIVANMGLQNPDQYRISYKLISEGHGKAESKVLAVALPENEASVIPLFLPIGLPAPFSIEISGLATLTAFQNGPLTKHMDTSVGLIDFGTQTSTFALFAKEGILALARRFDFGANSIVEKVQQTLGVDLETAQGIIADGAFDISQSVNEVMDPLVKQLIVSRDFVERREDCHIARIYVSGGLAMSRDCIEEMKSSMGLEVELWNPFTPVKIAPNAIPSGMEGQEWRFSAAIGACLATFEVV